MFGDFARRLLNAPNKLVNGDLRCYPCCSTPSVKERIKIFGKTAHDLPKLINEGLPGVLGNKGTLAKYPREHELIFREQGNKTLQIRGRKHCKQIHYKGNKYGKRAGRWQHRAILEGNKGTRNPPGRPSLILHYPATSTSTPRMICL